MELTYLASPYTHHDKDAIESRYLQAVAAVRALMAQGEHVFSPIVHCHILAKNSSLPLDWDYKGATVYNPDAEPVIRHPAEME